MRFAGEAAATLTSSQKMTRRFLRSLIFCLRITLVLIQAVLLLTLAIVLIPLSKRIGLGTVPGYVLAGIVAGPTILDVIHSNDIQDTMHFAELGVVMLLFLMGLELSPQKLKKSAPEIIARGGLQMTLSGVVIFALLMAIALAFGIDKLNPMACFVIAAGFATSCTAAAMQMLAETKETTTKHGKTTKNILIFQDIASVPVLTILPLLGAGAAQDVSMVKTLVVGIGAVVGLVVVAHFLIPPLFRIVANTRLPELSTGLTLLIVLASTWLMHVVSLSAELGAFIAGVMLANSPYRHDVETNLAPFQGLLMGLFFMSVGASADIRVFFASPLLVLGIVAGVMLVKSVILIFVAKRAQLHGASAWSLALLLACGGEFSFVIFSVGSGAGMIDNELTALLLISVTLSIVVTPLLFKARDMYIAHQAARGDFTQFDTILDKKPRVIVAGIGRFGKLVCRALHSRHVNFTAIDRDTNNVEFSKQFGKQFFYGDVSSSKLLESAGIVDAEVLVIAIDDVADSLKLAQLSQERWPHLRIIVRARDQEHAHGLMALGVEAIIRETLHAATDAATQAFEALGLSTGDAHDAIVAFREADEAALLESASAPSPEARRLAYVQLAMQSIQSDNVLPAAPSADA